MRHGPCVNPKLMPIDESVHPIGIPTLLPNAHTIRPALCQCHFHVPLDTIDKEATLDPQPYTKKNKNPVTPMQPTKPFNCAIKKLLSL